MVTIHSRDGVSYTEHHQNAYLASASESFLLSNGVVDNSLSFSKRLPSEKKAQTIVVKLRQILELEGKTGLDKGQAAKVASKAKVLSDLEDVARQLPFNTLLPAKDIEIWNMLPADVSSDHGGWAKLMPGTVGPWDDLPDFQDAWLRNGCEQLVAHWPNIVISRQRLPKLADSFCNRCSHLKSLDLADCEVDVAPLMTALGTCCLLANLALTGLHVKEQDAIALTEFLQNTRTLKTLGLGRTNHSAFPWGSGAERLFVALASNNSVTRLCLTGNQLSDVHPLAKFLQDNPPMVEIDLSRNRLEVSDGALLNSLKLNSTIINLGITRASVEEILEKNRKLALRPPKVLTICFSSSEAASSDVDVMVSLIGINGDCMWDGKVAPTTSVLELRSILHAGVEPGQRVKFVLNDGRILQDFKIEQTVADLMSTRPEATAEEVRVASPISNVPQSDVASTGPAPGPVDVEKRMKTLKKKLGQIQKLQERGGNFNKEEEEKLLSETSLKDELASLESGNCVSNGSVPFECAARGKVNSNIAPENALEVCTSKQGAQSQTASTPFDPPKRGPQPEQTESKVVDDAPIESKPVDLAKRIRALKKKLDQIQKLKERGGKFTKEESDKLACEPILQEELAALEQ